MTMRYLFLSLILLQLTSCSVFQANPYSQQDDLYWSALVDETQAGKKSIVDVIEKRNGLLFNQMINDSKDPLLLTFWGQSSNVDSGAKKQIINDEINQNLHLLFGLKSDNKTVHAGVAHTYGYLFSTLDTPYGYKRKRWIQPTLNFAFSLKGLSLSPQAGEGGLLSNLTYFAGTLAFSKNIERAELKKLKNVSMEIKNFNYFSLSLEHLEEEIPGFVLRTSLLRLPLKSESEENDYLLIYSILDQSKNKESLITVFPIKADAYQKLTDPKTLGNNRPISIRYNAYLAGLMDQKLTGNRRIFKESR